MWVLRVEILWLSVLLQQLVMSFPDSPSSNPEQGGIKGLGVQCLQAEALWWGGYVLALMVKADLWSADLFPPRLPVSFP